MLIKPQAFSITDQKLVKDFILKEWKEFGFTYHTEYDSDLDNIDSFYPKKGGAFFLLKYKGVIIGTIGVINKKKDIAELKRLYVNKKYRGLGLGSLLVDTALAFCKKHGFKKVEFETNKKFKIAHLLYQKKGFRLVKKDALSFYMEKKFKL